MKKITLLLTLTLSLLFANDSWFVGVETGNSGIKYKNRLNNSFNKTQHASHVGFKAGKYINPENRIYAQYSEFDITDTNNVKTYSLAYDHLFELGSKMHPILGLNYTHATAEDTLSSNHIVGNVGVSYRLSKFDIDAGYRHSIGNFGKNENIEADRFTQAYIGANYRFNTLEDSDRYVQDYSHEGYQPRKYMQDNTLHSGEVMYTERVIQEEYIPTNNEIIVNSIDEESYQKNKNKQYGIQYDEGVSK